MDADAREKALTRLIIKDEIGTVLARYAQAIDRCDIDLLKSVYWPDGYDDHGPFKGNAVTDFAEPIMPYLRAMHHTMHCIGNLLVDIRDDDHAFAQSYYMAYHEHADHNVTDPVQTWVGGRYLDHFERRGGEWRIAKRIVMMDWNDKRPSGSLWGGNEAYCALQEGGRHPEDLFYSESRLSA
jgi:hypothetical protein